MRQGIYWIASYPRSGNTWTRAFMAALEDIVAGRPIEKGRLAGKSERNFLKGGLNQKNLRKRAEAQMARASARPGITFEKSHSARLMIDGVPTINPAATAGAVYLVRDPRDVAVSFAAMFPQPLDQVISGMARSQWVSPEKGDQGFEVVGSWSENINSWRIAPDTLVLRYEDISAAPMKHFTALAHHIGIGASMMQIADAVAACSFERMQATARMSAKAFEGIQIRAGNHGRWRETLTPAQASRIESDHREAMQDFGYL